MQAYHCHLKFTDALDYTKIRDYKDTCCLYSPFLFAVTNISNNGTPAAAVASCLKNMKIHKDITLAGCTSSVQNGKVHLIKINSNTK